MDALALLSDEDDDDEIDEEDLPEGASSTEANFAVYVLVANPKNPEFTPMFCSNLW